MKKKYFFMACLAAIFMVSACNDDDDKAAVLPSAISNLTATPVSYTQMTLPTTSQV